MRGGETLLCSVVLCLEGGRRPDEPEGGECIRAQGHGWPYRRGWSGARGPGLAAPESSRGIAARQLSRRAWRPVAAAELWEDNAPRVFGYTPAA